MFISSIFGIAIENTDLVLCTSDILRPWYIGEKSWKHRSLFSTKHPRISYPSTVYPEMFSIFTQTLEYFSLLLVQFFSPPFYFPRANSYLSYTTNIRFYENVFPPIAITAWKPHTVTRASEISRPDCVNLSTTWTRARHSIQRTWTYVGTVTYL